MLARGLKGPSPACWGRGRRPARSPPAPLRNGRRVALDRRRRPAARARQRPAAAHAAPRAGQGGPTAAPGPSPAPELGGGLGGLR
eukprot:6940819-Pyramimonas_sp.AAC.1